MATLETNADVVRRLQDECYNEGNLDVADELVSPDYVEHGPSLSGTVRGIDGFKHNVTTYRTAFPDMEIRFEEVLQDGDSVAFRFTGRGTHEGDLLGMAPTGREVTVSGIEIDRVADGKVTEAWLTYNTYGMLEQLGVVEPIESAAEPIESAGERAADPKEAVVRRFFDELVNAGDFSAVDEILAPDYVRRDAGADDIQRGPGEFEEMLSGFRAAFPDMRVEIDDMYVADDAVVVKATETGTHEGDFMGAEPTGKRVEVEGLVVHRIADGRIVETFASWDFLGMMRRLGIVSMPGETAA
ncbi:ester cyclase [Halegenticoccus soli]|uniref:ester cyclase n=1 Tax=Halegenticoccus soli TaxID=1985678 RepID=UPI000C6E67F8|nr:ester cyclase [Halegenticoccus soli]